MIYSKKNTLLSTLPQRIDIGQKNIFYTYSLFPSTEDEKKDDVDSGPEEEEVPTRGYLKRQANLIVDAKSRLESQTASITAKKFNSCLCHPAGPRGATGGGDSNFDGKKTLGSGNWGFVLYSMYTILYIFEEKISRESEMSPKKVSCVIVCDLFGDFLRVICENKLLEAARSSTKPTCPIYLFWLAESTVQWAIKTLVKCMFMNPISKESVCSRGRVLEKNQTSFANRNCENLL